LYGRGKNLPFASRAVHPIRERLPGEEQLMKVSAVCQVHAMDRAAIDQYGIVEELLMENAGHEAFSVLKQMGAIANRSFVLTYPILKQKLQILTNFNTNRGGETKCRY
jgi:hypothetical protein